MLWSAATPKHGRDCFEVSAAGAVWQVVFAAQTAALVWDCLLEHFYDKMCRQFQVWDAAFGSNSVESTI